MKRLEASVYKTFAFFILILNMDLDSKNKLSFWKFSKSPEDRRLNGEIFYPLVISRPEVFMRLFYKKTSSDLFREVLFMKHSIVFTSIWYMSEGCHELLEEREVNMVFDRMELGEIHN